MINYLALFSAIFVSAIAAYYSIAGLVAIFAAAAFPIIMMGVSLEVAKLVAASWVYRNWYTCPKFVKYYLVTAVAVLMFITSMGIFGFLSKAHLDQTKDMSVVTFSVQNIEREIKSEQRIIENAQRSLEIMDRLVDNSDPKDANVIRNRQKREREAVNREIRAANDKIKNLTSELAPIKKEVTALEAEVGPIKYIADLIYGEDAKSHIDSAIRWVIIIIVFVFDPLAVILLIAANIGLNQKPVKPQKPRVKKTDDSWIESAKSYLDKSKQEDDLVTLSKKKIMKIE